ncbi:MAG: hypothetical protein ABIF92_01765 [archaeon]
MRKTAIILLAILIVISMSGCLQGGSSKNQVGTGYPGVEFIEFYPVNNKVPKSSDVSLYYAIQNNGYFDAEGVNVTIYNCGDIKTGTHSWISKPYNCNDGIQLPSAGGVLVMPDRDQGVSGEVADAEVTLSTDFSVFPVGETPHTFSARLVYNYTTTAARDVVFTTFNNWKEKGGNIETGVLMSSSKPAPITVSVNAPDQAIIITGNETEDQAQEFTIAVQSRNTGGGYLKDKQLNSIKLCYDTNLVAPVVGSDKYVDDFVLCTGEDAAVWDQCCLTSGIQTDAGEEGTSRNCLCVAEGGLDPKLKMIGVTNQWRDVSATFKTKMDADGKKAVVKVQDIANFGATVKYTYMSDTSTQITLVGKSK